jgi:hypothetical protein
MSKVHDQLPTLSLGQGPTGHAGVTDAVHEVEVNLPVTLRLHDALTQIRWTRVFAGRNLSFSAPVIGVADLALLSVDRLSGDNVGAVGLRDERILTIAVMSRNGVIQKPLR